MRHPRVDAGGRHDVDVEEEELEEGPDEVHGRGPARRVEPRDDGALLNFISDSQLRYPFQVYPFRDCGAFERTRAVRGSPKHSPSSKALETCLTHSQKPTEF